MRVPFPLFVLAAASLALAGCAESPRTITGTESARTVTGAKTPPGSTVQNLPGDSWASVLPRGYREIGPFTATYPLVPGRSLDYEVIFQVGVDTGSGYQLGPALRYERNRTITCSQPAGNDEWFAERWTDTPGGTNWLMLRQDRTGLYEQDQFLPSPPACEAGTSAIPSRSADDVRRALDRRWSVLAANSRVALHRDAWQKAWTRNLEKVSRMLVDAGRLPIVPNSRAPLPGPPDGQLRRLAYPLRPGKAWVVRQDPLFGSRVEAVETLLLPAGPSRGYRIRMSSELYGPDDDVLEWYGPEGFLRLTVSAVSEVVDDSGNVIGSQLVVMEERLTHINRTAQIP